MPAPATRLYRFGKWFLGWVFRLHFQVAIRGAERVPREGGLLVVGNHISLADPPLLAVVMPRPADYLAAAELFQQPVLRWVLPGVRAIPVDRGRVDAGATRQAIRRLREGACVVIFPEGGIRLGERSVLGGQPDIKPGAAAIARLGQCAILPVILRNTRTAHDWRNWLRRPLITVTFGYPFCLWTPGKARDEAQRARIQQVLREELLKTVAVT